MKNKQAFTLIELLVVVLIIGILAAVALPQYQLAVQKTQLSNIRVYVDALHKGAELYFLTNNDYPRDIRDIDIILQTPVYKPSTLSSGIIGGFFPDGTECISTGSAVGCRNDNFYLTRYHDHFDSSGSDLKAHGQICFGFNSQSEKICRSLSNGISVYNHPWWHTGAYVIGN